MMEQISPDPGTAQKTNGPSLPPVLGAVLAVGICAGLLFLGHRSGDTIASPAAGAIVPPALPAQALPAAQPLPAAPAMRPLGISLEEISARHTTAIKPTWTEPILSGPLEGGQVKKYMTGSGTDDLYILNGAVYRRVMSFRLAEMVESVEGTHAHFSGLVFIYALYPSAFNKPKVTGPVAPEVQKLADAYGAKCGALAEPGTPTAEYREVLDGYVFYCSNRDTTRLIYGVCSEGLLAAEAAAGK